MSTDAFKKYAIAFCVILTLVLCLTLAFILLSSCKIVSVCASALDLSDIPNITINLKYHGHNFVYNSSEHIPNVTNFLQERTLHKHNRTGTHVERATVIDCMVNNRIPIRDAFCYMFFDWQEYFDKVLGVVNIEPKDAELKFLPHQAPYFEITKERIGYKLNQDDVLRNIVTELYKTDNITLELTPKALLPNVYATNLKRLTSKLSSFSTSYASSSVARKHNVSLALSHFDGMRVAPKQTISFNNITGERTKERGYQEAHMILEHEYVDAVGGGVCQASTTLYNALLLARLDIDEVHSHSLPSSYVDLGFDAMVNFGTSDLRFTNPYDTPIFIRVECNNKTVKVEIFGQNYAQNIKIKRVNEIISRISPPIDKVEVDAQGEYLDKIQYKDEWLYKKQPKDGFKVKAYLEYYKDGKLLKRKSIRTVTYQPQQGIKIYGAKNRPKLENIDSDFLQTLGNILGKN